MGFEVRVMTVIVIPIIVIPIIDPTSGKCYKRVLCAEVCGLMVGLYADGTSFPTRPNRHSSLLLCLAVEACSERVRNSGGGRTRGGSNPPAGG